MDIPGRIVDFCRDLPCRMVTFVRTSDVEWSLVVETRLLPHLFVDFCEDLRCRIAISAKNHIELVLF